MVLPSITVSQYGLKQFQKQLSPSRWKRARRRALNVAAKDLRAQLEADSRVKSGHYKNSWRIDRSGQDSRTVYNQASYSPYVTGASMRSTWKPKRGAGEAFMRKARREFVPRARRKMERDMLDYIKGA